MKKRLFSLTSIAFLFSSLSAQADWMQEHEAPYTIVNSSSTVTVDKTGLSESIIESEMQVMNEEGRNHLILQKIPFLPEASTVTFIKASSITDGVESAVQAKDVTSRPTKGPAQGLSHARELVIPFNNLKIGSITKYTIKIKEKKNQYKGLFQQSYSVGVEAPEKAGRAKIKSLVPLYVNVNDPFKVITSKESREGEYYVFEFEQTKPLFKVPKEPLAVLTKDLVTQVDISTMKEWNSYVSPLAKKYEDILKVKALPTPFTRIIAKAKKAPDTVSKINIVTSELANIMTYSGNWTTMEKMIIAQPLKDIARTKTGDCKDFSLATTAMLRALGIDAKVALVKRTSDHEAAGITVEVLSPQLVMANIFNHAIVKVKDGDQTLWVDPTNVVSNAGFIFSDIAGSKALEVSESSKDLETVPYPDSKQSHLSFDKTIKINADGSSDAVTNFEATGDYAKYVSQASFSSSEEAAKKALMTFLRSDSKNSKALYENTNFRNRIAATVGGTQKTIGEEIVRWEDKKLLLNSGFPLSALAPLALNGYRVTRANLISRFSESTVTHVVGYDFVGYETGCTILTPWYRITREFVKEDKGFRIVDEAVFDQTTISADDANSDKYSFMASSLAECAKDSIVEIKPIQPGATLQTRLEKYSTKDALAKLAIGGPKSIEGAREAYHIAGQILSKDPENKDALIVRARAVRRVNYINNSVDRSEYLQKSSELLDTVANRFPDDPQVLQQRTWVAIFRKETSKLSALFNQAYKASPKDYDLYSLGGEVLKELNQVQGSIGSYTKAFEMARNNSEKADAAADLGELLITNNQIENGIAYYKYAIKADPGNAWLAGNFSALIQHYGRWDDAIAVGEEVVKTNPYGMAKSTLAKAYAGKANLIIVKPTDNPLDQAKNLDSSEQLYAKGLSHSPGSEECLLGLARVYYSRALIDKNPMTAQKSLRYLDKAVASKKIPSGFLAPMRSNLNLIADGKPAKEPTAGDRVLERMAAGEKSVTIEGMPPKKIQIPAKAVAANPATTATPNKTPASVGAAIPVPAQAQAAPAEPAKPTEATAPAVAVESTNPPTQAAVVVTPAPAKTPASVTAEAAAPGAAAAAPAASASAKTTTPAAPAAPVFVAPKPGVAAPNVVAPADPGAAR